MADIKTDMKHSEADSPAPQGHPPEARARSFARLLEPGAGRREPVVYASLISFFVLAASGLVLVYLLVRDIRVLSASVDQQMSQHLGAVSRSIDELVQTISGMSSTVAGMANDLRAMDRQVAAMKGDTGVMAGNTGAMVAEMDRMEAHMAVMAGRLHALDPMVANTAAMSEHMKSMSISMGLLSRDVGRPLNFMNQVAPW